MVKVLPWRRVWRSMHGAVRTSRVRARRALSIPRIFAHYDWRKNLAIGKRCGRRTETRPLCCCIGSGRAILLKASRPRQGLPERGRHFSKRACKPNSVVCGHSSRRRVAADVHQRPTRRFRHLLEPPVAYRADTPRRPVLGAFGASLPIWSCSVWGLPCPTPYGASGALLPHLFTLTSARVEQALRGMPDSLSKARVAEAVFSLWHWPSMRLEAHVPDVIRHTALRSSDFPPPFNAEAKTAATAQLVCCFYSTCI
jgi:hypothetical protein